MSEYNVQKLAFTSLSRENWKLIKWLNEKDTYLVIQSVADYILNGERPKLEGMAGMAAEQIIATIDRKGEKTINSVNNLNKNKNNALPEQKSEIVVENNEKKEKKELTEVEKWANAVIQDTDGKGQEYFEKRWEEFFSSPQEADIYLSNYETKVI